MASYTKENEITIVGGLISLDGKKMIKKEIGGHIEKSESLGTELAESVLSAGGDEILLEIKNQLQQ